MSDDIPANARLEAMRLLERMVETAAGDGGKAEARRRMSSLLTELEAADDLTLGIVLSASHVASEATMQILARRMGAS